MLDEQTPTDSNIMPHTRGPRVVKKRRQLVIISTFVARKREKYTKKSSKYRFENIK